MQDVVAPPRQPGVTRWRWRAPFAATPRPCSRDSADERRREDTRPPRAPGSASGAGRSTRRRSRSAPARLGPALALAAAACSARRMPRCERNFFTAKGSVMVAMTRIFVSHFGQRSASKPNVRCSSTAPSTRKRDDIAKSSPSTIRFQCFAVMIVGSPKATGTTCAGDALDGDASGGDGGAFAGVWLRYVGGAPGDGEGDAGGGERGGGAATNATVSASLHDVDFFGLARPSGGFGVTSLRHEDRAAKTP